MSGHHGVCVMRHYGELLKKMTLSINFFTIAEVDRQSRLYASQASNARSQTSRR